MYCTTISGGANGYGTVFSLSGGKETVLHSFGSQASGALTGVIKENGFLYDTTTESDGGSVFKLGTK